MSNTTILTIVGLSLIAGCAGSENEVVQEPNNSATSQRQQSVRAAETTGRLVAMSNALVGASAIGQRSNFVEDLNGDIEAGIDDFLDGMQDAACVSFDLVPLSDDAVELSFDFSDCVNIEGTDVLTGEVQVRVSSNEAGIDVDYEGDIVLAGTALHGSWSIDIDGFGSAIVGGKLDISFADGITLAAELDASWKDLGGLCPILDQHIVVAVDNGEVSVDLGGLDLCAASLCGSDLDILVSDLDGLAEVDLADLDDGFADALLCDVSDL